MPDDKTIHLPDDLSTLPVFVVSRDTPAWDALVRMARTRMAPGVIVPVSDEEFRSLKEDVLAVASVEPGGRPSPYETEAMQFKGSAAEEGPSDG